MVESPSNKLLLLAAIGLHPALTGMVVKGMNDVLIVLALVLVAIAMAKRRLLLSALFVGLACTIKQSAWLFLPFYLLLLVLLKYQWKRNSIGTMLLCGSIFMFGIGFLSRFFQDNYVGFITVIIILGILLNMSREHYWEAVPRQAKIVSE